MNKDEFLAAIAALERIRNGNKVSVTPLLEELGVPALLGKDDATRASVDDITRLLRVASRLDRVFSARLPWNPQMILFGASASHVGGMNSHFTGDGMPLNTDYGGVGFNALQAFRSCIGEAAEHDAMLMRQEDHRIGHDGTIHLLTADFSFAGTTDAKSVLRSAGLAAHAHPRTSTGYAAGPDLRQAAQAAVLECVERHVLASWFSGECALTELIPPSAAGTVWADHPRFASDDLKFHLIHHDLGEIPVVIAVSRMEGGEIVAGYGCAGDEQGAALKAYREACQGEFGLQLDMHNSRKAHDGNKRSFVHLARSAMFRAQPARFSSASRRKMNSAPSFSLTALASAFPDLRLVDLTLSEDSVPVVCALVPGLRDITAERQGRIPWPV